MTFDALLALDAVRFSYPDGKLCLDGVDLRVEPGGFVLVRGPSGGGKSTLLRLLARLETPQSGRLLYRGQDAREVPAPEYRRAVCLIQQTPVVVSGSVRDNLLLPYRFAANKGLAVPDDAAMRRGLDGLLLEGVSLDAAAKGLSVGQRQRLCLLRAMLLGPGAMLMDEPTSALDPESRTVVEDAAERACREHGVAVVMVCHNDYEPRTVPFRTLRALSCRIEEAP